MFIVHSTQWINGRGGVGGYLTKVIWRITLHHTYGMDRFYLIEKRSFCFKNNDRFSFLKKTIVFRFLKVENEWFKNNSFFINNTTVLRKNKNEIKKDSFLIVFQFITTYTIRTHEKLEFSSRNFFYKIREMFSFFLFYIHVHIWNRRWAQSALKA